LTKFVFYLNPKANGTTETDNCPCPSKCCLNIFADVDANFSMEIVRNLTQLGLNVSGLSFHGPPMESDVPAVLKYKNFSTYTLHFIVNNNFHCKLVFCRWGETIPLSFLSGLNCTKIMILSQPSIRYTEPVDMIPHLLNLGKNPTKIAFLIQKLNYRSKIP